MFKIAIASLALVCNLHAKQFYSADTLDQAKKEIAGKKHVISLKDIICENNDIFVALEGEFYPIRSLEKSGSGWLAEVDSYNEFCPAGHGVCGICHLCHVSRCHFYVPQCSER